MDTADVETRWYEYRIELYMKRLWGEGRGPSPEYNDAKEHLDLARKYGMNPRAIWERLSSNSWYRDLEDGESRALLDGP